MNYSRVCLTIVLSFSVMTTMLVAQAPKYCKTDAGVLGPYPNDGSVGVGDRCFGTKNGNRYEGVAVLSRASNDDSDSSTTDSKPSKGGAPKYCKTDAGVLGPYPNDGSVGVGDACFGTKNGNRYEGVAVLSRTSNDDSDSSTTDSKPSKGGAPKYCKTDAGVLGPYPNDGSVGVGDRCFGTKNGNRYEGVAVLSRTSNDDSDSSTTDSKPSKGGAPKYCKTDAGVLGPYPNDGSVGVGDRCFGTKNGNRYEGVAVLSRTSNDE